MTKELILTTQRKCGSMGSCPGPLFDNYPEYKARPLLRFHSYAQDQEIFHFSHAGGNNEVSDLVSLRPS